MSKKKIITNFLICVNKTTHKRTFERMFYYKKSNNTSTNLFIEEEGYGSFNIISIIYLVSANFIDGCNWTTEENPKAVASH